MKCQIALLLVFVSLGFGCSKKKVSTAQNVPTVPAIEVPDSRLPQAPQGTSPEQEEIYLEREADFTPASESVFQEYVGNRPLNSPERYKLAVNVQEMWNNDIGGEIRLTYYDNGQKFQGIFKSGDRETDIQYNSWFDFGADEVFTGYFSDNFGAIVLVVDDVVDLGDGGGDEVLNGKVYFVNYEPTRAPQSPTKCWNIEYGPYACGAEFTGITPGDVINHDFPGKTYKLLGTFKGLSRSKAFNTDFNP